MKKLILFVFLSCSAFAQVQKPGVIYVTTAPSGTCSAQPPIQVVISTGTAYTCNNGTWAAVSGSGGSLPTATAQGQTLISSGAGTTYTAKNTTNEVFLSAASDIGAQINTAVTSLSSVGRIILPNSTNIPMSTTANIPPGVSVKGYGKLASIINCTVAGDCFSYTQNPTSVGEISSEYSDFEINGSGASNQVLWHNHGISGATFHDIQFEPYAGSGNAATCLEFENAATGQFTEGNRTYNVSLERQCLTGVLFSQNTADSSTSFGYNFFEFHVVAQGANYGVTFTASSAGSGTAFLYNGDLIIYGNHVGPGGGMLQFLNGVSTDSSLGIPNERLYIAAEENGTGAGVLINVPGSGSILRFYGNVVNGAFNGSGTSLATTYNDPNVDFILNTDMQVDHNGNYYIPANGLTIQGVAPVGVVGLNIVSLAANTYGGLQIDDSLIAGGTVFQHAVVGHAFVEYNTTDATEPFESISVPTTFKNLAKTTALGQFCWDPASQFFGTTCDTGFSRLAAGVVAVGNGTQAAQAGLLLTGDTCRVTSPITLSTSATNICSWSLPAAAQSWGFVCHIPYAISAGTLPTFALGMNASQAPANETAYASINSTNTGTSSQGSATSAASGAVAILTGASVATGSTYQAQVFGTIQASATAGTFAITATLAGTTPAGTIPVGATCTLQ